jgi:hypothetical protein
VAKEGTERKRTQKIMGIRESKDRKHQRKRDTLREGERSIKSKRESKRESKRGETVEES